MSKHQRKLFHMMMDRNYKDSFELYGALQVYCNDIETIVEERKNEEQYDFCRQLMFLINNAGHEENRSKVIDLLYKKMNDIRPDS